MDNIRALIRRIVATLDHSHGFVLLLVRAVVGVEFAISGYGKLGRLDHLVQSFEGWGIPLPVVQAPFVAGMELAGGVCILIGLATRFFAFTSACTMLVALLTVFANEPGAVTSLPADNLGNILYLPETLLLTLFLVLVFTGPGKLSLDHALAPKLKLR